MRVSHVVLAASALAARVLADTTYCDWTLQVVNVPDWAIDIGFKLPNTIFPYSLSEYGTTCSTDTFWQTQIRIYDITAWDLPEQASTLSWTIADGGGTSSLNFALEQSLVDACTSAGSALYTIDFWSGHPPISPTAD